jgi:FkbM family methyltransferase
MLDITRLVCQTQRILKTKLHQFLKFLYSLNFPLLKRILPSLIKRLKILNNNQLIELEDFKIKIDLKQSIDREIYLNGFYEREQITFLKKICNQNKITHFLDIGANIGYYTLKFKNILNIYAFEPNKKNYLRLTQNINLNKLNIETYNFGLSNTNSISEIWYTDKNKMGGSAVYDKGDTELSKYNKKNIFKEKILLKKLDDVLDLKNLNILVKIDVERHEKKVLEGMRNLINQNNIVLQIEIGDKKKEDVHSYLKSLNFKWIKTISHDYFFIKDLMGVLKI